MTCDETRGATAVLVLSQYLEPEFALRLLEDGEGGIGYLLKDRVADAAQFLDGVRRADRLQLGIRMKLGGSAQFAADACDHGSGSALAEYVNSRAAGFTTWTWAPVAEWPATSAATA